MQKYVTHSTTTFAKTMKEFKMKPIYRVVFQAPKSVNCLDLVFSNVHWPTFSSCRGDTAMTISSVVQAFWHLTLLGSLHVCPLWQEALRSSNSPLNSFGSSDSLLHKISQNTGWKHRVLSQRRETNFWTNFLLSITNRIHYITPPYPELKCPSSILFYLLHCYNYDYHQVGDQSSHLMKVCVKIRARSIPSISSRALRSVIIRLRSS